MISAPGAARRGHVDRIDLVDALDEDALAPVDHLVAEAQLQVGIADVEASVDVRIEQHQVRELLLVLEALVAQRVLGPDLVAGTRHRDASGDCRRACCQEAVRQRGPERRALAIEAVGLVAEIHLAFAGGVVVPGLDAHEAAELALLVLDVAQQLERRREAVVAVVVERRLTRGPVAGGAVALRQRDARRNVSGVQPEQRAVAHRRERLAGVLGAPARAGRQRGVPVHLRTVVELELHRRRAARVGREHRADHGREHGVAAILILEFARHQYSPIALSSTAALVCGIDAAMQQPYSVHSCQFPRA